MLGDRNCRHRLRTTVLLSFRFLAGPVVSSNIFCWTTELKDLNPLHRAILFILKSLFFRWVVRTDPWEGTRGLLASNMQSGLSCCHSQCQTTL